MSEDDFKDDELITIKLPRKQYEMLKSILEREEAMSWLQSRVKAWWIWTAAGGLIAVWTLWDKFHEKVGF